MNPLIVIPVRGGSVGIPNKAFRPLGGMCPLLRTITTVRELDATAIVVTDDIHLAAIAQGWGAHVQTENVNPGGLRTVDRAVWGVVADVPVEIVATVQCTSPFLKADTIQKCLTIVQSGEADTVITVREDRHVAWTGQADAPQLATPWDVRQLLPLRWALTGGCIATRRECMTPERRFGGHVQLVEVVGAEAVDLDAPADWALAEWYSGEPSSRETLMAKVLSDGGQPWRGVVACLSAWAESPEEAYYRNGVITYGNVLRLRGQHTADEARLALDRLDGAEDVTIVTSAYHQVRAFLTFLRVLQDRKLDRIIRLHNAPAPSRMDKLVDEWRKIREYQQDVASIEDGLAYLQWRDSNVGAIA